ncbi:alpha/beta hydrolase [Sinimarinibacterium thermocellulolyticum]|uniref:Alpha/beta hydrolase n=1 Tax=Sinimarinibacterium thermocellulolyticum TaxID=3170016 RepID=A0ABV2ADM6_9GAMM
MGSTQFQFDLGHGRSAYVHAWLPTTAPRAAVEIVHGMAEHGARYARLGSALAAHGHAVYAADLPGHGRSVRDAAELGHVADRDGWRLSLSAIHALRGEIERRHVDVPLVLLGHSRGSFLLQHYLFEHGSGLAGAVFSAGTADLGPLRALGLLLMRIEARFLGGAHRSALAEALTFKAFNRHFKPTRTDFDWLSRDAAEVDAYVRDPLCGFRCSAALWIELLEAGGQLRDARRLARIPKTLPVLLLNGAADPACRFESGARTLATLYRDAGLRDVTQHVYADARHELFNDVCRDQVTQDLIAWLASRTSNQEPKRTLSAA